MTKKRRTILLAAGVLLLVSFQVANNHLHLLQSPGVVIEDYVEPDYELGAGHIDSLIPYPDVKKGERTPFDLWRYGGKGKSSFTKPELPMAWEEWLKFHEKQKPELMADVREYMDSRFNFSGEAYEGKTMSGGRKPIMKGPITRLPKGISFYEDLDKYSPEEIRNKELFPLFRWRILCIQLLICFFQIVGTKHIRNMQELM